MTVLCLGINRTWRAGGVNAGEAAGSVSEDRGLFLERLTRKEVALRRVQAGEAG